MGTYKRFGTANRLVCLATVLLVAAHRIEIPKAWLLDASFECHGCNPHFEGLRWRLILGRDGDYRQEAINENGDVIRSISGIPWVFDGRNLNFSNGDRIFFYASSTRNCLRIVWNGKVLELKRE